ncbi:MAG TPA: YebC/PmpR family DNA-binding transcriptional regulator [bacterium]|nr:YebC/PmpR family DNA-binding transcriptional regulator [bacterium]HPL95416.1 YebC/PmpR family DNA-binding transcriptional regulator [bacterium]
MSGHSKWATTKRKKFAVDAKRSSVFTKLANNVTVAARHGGGDPEMNFRLRLAIERAKAASMPKENIERAIKRGLGELDGQQLEEVIYEGYGPGQVAVLVECLTDNRNRTHGEIKKIFENFGGTLAGQGAVMWQFEKKGVIIINNQNLSEEIELKIIDAGADDFVSNENEITVYTKPEDLQRVKEKLEHEKFHIESAALEYVAKEKIDLAEPQEETLVKFIEELEGQNEVNEYYLNN